VYTGCWWGNLRERDHLEGVDEMIILRWIVRKWDVKVWIGSIWLKLRTGGGNCECGNENSGFCKMRGIS
jgi:hypothetical protein